MSTNSIPHFDEYGLPTRRITINNFMETFIDHGPSGKGIITDIFVAFRMLGAYQPDMHDDAHWRRLIVQHIHEYYRDTKYAAAELRRTCDYITAHNIKLRSKDASSTQVIADFYQRWRREMLKRIDFCIRYRVTIDVCNGDLMKDMQVTCRALLIGRDERFIHGMFSRDMEHHEIPTYMKMSTCRHFAVSIINAQIIDAVIISPDVSDEYWNDTHLGLGLISSGDAGGRTAYPIGTLFMRMPTTPAMEKAMLDYEMRWIYMSLVRSGVLMSDESIDKMMKFMLKAKIKRISQ